MAIYWKLPMVVCLGLVVGCGTEESSFELPVDLRASTSALSPWDGTPEVMALVEFLNDRSTTEEVLDFDIALDSRAAGNIIVHRNGGDDRYGTTDDDLYQSIAEVDRVRWVGPRTIQRMVNYIDEMELIPEYDETLGTWDGVRFTVSQAFATLEFTNSASEETLDDDLNLDRRAVDSIMEARPVGSIAHLAGLYYVGKTALRRLKDAGRADW